MKTTIALVKFVSLLTIQIVAICGNLLMIVVGLKCKSLRKFQNSFIFNMALADLLQGLLIMTSALINVYNGQWILGQPACDVFGILKVTLTLSSVYSLSGTSVLRYFYVVKRTKRMNTMRKAVSCIVGSWVISISLSMTPLFDWGMLGFEDGKEVCTVLFHLTTSHTSVIFVTGLFLNVVIMVVCYICIFLKLRHTNQRIRVNSKKSQFSSVVTANRYLAPSSSTPLKKISTITELSPDLANINNIQHNQKGLLNSKNQNDVVVDDNDFDTNNNDNNNNGTVISSNEIRLDCYHHDQQTTTTDEKSPHDVPISCSLNNSSSSLFDKFIGNSSHLPLSQSKSVGFYQHQKQEQKKKQATDSVGNNHVLLSRSLSFLGRQQPLRSTSSLTSFNKKLRTNSFTNNIPRTEMNLLKTICAIVVVFICCWTPYVLFNMIRMFGWSADNNTADTITMWLGFVNSAINPVIYGVMNSQFRNAMRNVLALRTSQKSRYKK